MSFSRRSLVKGSVGAAAAFAMPGVITRRGVRAQSASYEVVDFVTFEEVIYITQVGLGGGFNDLTNEGVIGGFIVVSDKLSPSVWSPDGEIKRYKTDAYGGSIYSINDDGVAVGVVWGDVKFGKAMPALWRNGKAREVVLPADLDGEISSAGIYGVNDDGIAFGAINLQADDGTNSQRSLIWSSDGEVSDLTVPEGATDLILSSINPSGTVVGSIAPPLDGSIAGIRAIILWENGQPTLLENLEDYYDSNWPVYAAGISADGQVLANIGRQYRESLGVIYDRGTPSRLPFLREDHIHTFGTAISDNGQILGYSGDWKGEMIPTIWVDGSPQDLTALISDMQGFEFRDLRQINNDGVITATATISVEGLYATPHGLVLRPA